MQKHHESIPSAANEIEPSEILGSAEAQLAELEEHATTPRQLDELVAGFTNDAEAHMVDGSPGEIEVAEVAGLEMLNQPYFSQQTAGALDHMPIDSLAPALRALENGKGPEAAAFIVNTLDAAHRENETAFPEEIDGVRGDEVEYMPKSSSTDRDPSKHSLGDRMHARYVLEHTAKQWREDTFGMREIEPLTNDLTKHLEMPNEQRRGEILIDGDTGKERLPIMDITLDEATKQMVCEEVVRRSNGIAHAIKELRELQSSEVTESEKHTRCSELLRKYRRQGTWEAKFSSGVADDHNGPGSVADLYIDGDDLALYDQADGIINSLGEKIDSRAEINGRLLSLAVSTFPAGTELMHVTTDQGLQSIRQQGSLSPRSELLYGADLHNTPVNGSYIHLTEPGTAAYEYGSHAPDVIGVPIEEVIARSPILHLEPSYIHNELRLTQEEVDAAGSSSYIESVQQPMAKFTINRPLEDGMPLAFRQRLARMHDKLSDDMPEVALIGLGSLNNYSFAASDDVRSAGRYRYDFKDCRVIMQAGRIQAKQKNFDLSDNPLVVYGPVVTQRVDFTEASIDGSQRPVPSLENTDPDQIDLYLGEIIANNPGDTQVAIDRVAEVIRAQGERGIAGALYSMQRAELPDDTKISLLNKLPVEIIARGYALDEESDNLKRQVLARVFAEKSELPPDWIEWPLVQESGYTPTDAEKNSFDTMFREQAAGDLARSSDSEVHDLSF